MEAITLSLTAFGLGVLHALEPGHGKVLSASTLIGSRRKWLDPMLLASSTALGHAVGVMLFVTISFFLAHEFAGEELRHIVEGGAGLIVVCVGASLLYSTLKRARSNQQSSKCCSCSCVEKQTNILTKHVPVIGFLIGLVPCPSALAVSLSATKVGSLSQAIFLSLTFAFGVAVTLSTLGIIFTHSADRIEALVPRLERFKPYIPLISPIMVVLLGVVMIGHGVVH